MTCITTRTAPAALHAYLSDLFSANVLGGAPIIPESNEWFVVMNDYAVAEEFRSMADQILHELDDSQCCDETLFKRAADFGVYPSPGDYASGYVKFTGTPGAELPNDLNVVIGSNSYARAPYSTSAKTIGPDGTAIVLMRATRPGAAANNTSGSAAANMLQAYTGVDSTVQVMGAGFCNGRDAETAEQFRARFLARKKYTPAGNWDWLVREIEGWPCVTRICRRTTGACNTGRIEAFAMIDGVFPHGLPPESVNNDLTAWMFGNPNGMGLGRAAIGVFGKFFTATAAPVDVSITGLGCLSADHLSRLRSAIEQLFATLCPGQTLCRRMIEALIVTIAGVACAPVVSFTSTSAGVVIATNGDAIPQGDFLVTINRLTMV